MSSTSLNDGLPGGIGKALQPHPERLVSAEASQSDQQYRTILHTALDGFWIVDTQGRFLEVNDAYCRLIGYSREELLTLSLMDVEARDSQQAIAGHIGEAIASGSVRLSMQHRTRDGRLLDLEASANYQPETGRLSVFVRDVTERKQLEAALLESESRYRLVAEKMRDVFYRTDMGGTVLSVSPSAAKLFGVADTQVLIGRNLRTDGILLEAEMMEFFRILTTVGEVREHDMKLRAADGTLLDITTNSRFVLGDRGAPIGVEGVFRDVTARKAAEREKEALAAQLLQSQKLESLGRLAGGIAHDFNNILTVINGRCDLMISSMRPEDPLRESLLEVRSAGGRAAALTRQMLAFSRKQLFQPAALDINQVLTDALSMLQRMVGEESVIECDLAPDAGWVMADDGLLHQVLMNLVVNARDAMPDGGRITVTTRSVDGKSGPQVLLVVSDTGRGMDESLLARIFDPFFTTKSVGQGTGLGLSTVHGIIHQLEGSIEVHSTPGQGTSFRILLPKAGRPFKPTGSQSDAGDPRGQETVMVVEDQPEVRRLTVDCLRDLGYDVLEATCGEEALRLAETDTKAIHLLLTDVVMPGIKGPDLAHRLRALRPAVKVLFMSGYTSGDLDRHGLARESTDLIWKPFLPRQLATRIRALLDRNFAG